MYGQTAFWIIKPSVYNEISYVAPNIYKVVKNGKIGLISGDGTLIAEPNNDCLTGYINNIALLTKNENGKERVTGTLNINGTFNKFVTSAYTLWGQAFYSDGLLTVSFEDGSLGYIDEKGTTVLNLENKYDRIKPFTEGYAAVFNNKKYNLIDIYGNPTRFMFNGVGEVYGGTNPFNGIVYIWDTTGKFYIYDTATGGNCKKVKAPNDINNKDYLYRFSCITGMPKQPEFKVPSTPTTSDPDYPSVFDGSKGKGYELNGQTVLPCQFTTATPYLSGSAVVTKNGKYGLLGFTTDEKFKITPSAEEIRFHTGKPTQCMLHVQIPQNWESKQLNIEITDEDNTPIHSTHTLTEVTFDERPQSTCNKAYNIHISGEGLSLLDTQITQRFIQIQVCHTCHEDLESCKYKGKHPATKTSDNNKDKENTWY